MRKKQVSNLKEIIKATLFVSGEGIEKKAIAEKLGLTDKQFEKELEKVKQDFNEDSGIILIEYKINDVKSK